MKKEHECPRCGSHRIAVSGKFIACDDCGLKQTLVDFDTSPLWDNYYQRLFNGK